ncbi:unnamed protein product, partial [Musa banksii]
SESRRSGEEQRGGGGGKGESGGETGLRCRGSFWRRDAGLGSTFRLGTWKHSSRSFLADCRPPPPPFSCPVLRRIGVWFWREVGFWELGLEFLWHFGAFWRGCYHREPRKGCRRARVWGFDSLKGGAEVVSPCSLFDFGHRIVAVAIWWKLGFCCRDLRAVLNLLKPRNIGHQIFL